MDINDRELLARIIEAEAGNQGVRGMTAVGNVIRNRMAGGNSLRDVVLARGQFSPLNTYTGYAGGEQGQDMANLQPSKDAYAVADAILSGSAKDITGGATHFYNPSISNPSWGQQAGGDWTTIGDHVFGQAGGFPVGEFKPAGQTPASKPPVPQAKEQAMNAPQAQGLMGLLGRLGQPNEQTGLSPFQNFAQALDPLIMPEMRGGEAIRASGQRRMAEQTKNRTIEMLKQRAQQGDETAAQVLQGIESGAFTAKEGMSLYYGKLMETPTEKETFTNVTGAQLNEQYGTQLDPTKMYNVSSSGKITQVGGAGTNVTVGGSEKAWERGIGELGVKTLEKIQNDAASAVDMLGQTQILTSLMNDPAFQSGALAEPKMAYKKIIEALGGDPANVGSQEAFQAVTAQLILDKMGGSLGAGFSEGDRKFVERMAPALSTSKIGNQLIIQMNNAIANRKIQINDFANAYIAENGMLDQNFNAALSKWAKENPIFVDVNTSSYFE